MTLVMERSRTLSREVTRVIRDTRNDTLDAAAEICDALAQDGHSASCCARALRELKSKMVQADH